MKGKTRNFSYITVEERSVQEGLYIIENNATVRETAKYFGVCKSTVHRDITKVLKKASYTVYKETKSVLEKNKQIRHLHGGEATKQRWINMKKQRSATI